jgi:hypothetical protein
VATRRSAARLQRSKRTWPRESDLRGLRIVAGVAQTTIAAKTGLDQPEVSRTERRSDHLVSTLRRYVEALGGKLEVRARFGNKSVKLKGV